MSEQSIEISLKELAKLQVKARFFEQFKKTPVGADMINELAAYYIDAHQRLEAIEKEKK